MLQQLPGTGSLVRPPLQHLRQEVCKHLSLMVFEAIFVSQQLNSGELPQSGNLGKVVFAGRGVLLKELFKEVAT